MPEWRLQKLNKRRAAEEQVVTETLENTSDGEERIMESLMKYLLQKVSAVCPTPPQQDRPPPAHRTSIITTLSHNYLVIPHICTYPSV